MAHQGRQLTRNAIGCKHCGDVVESRHRHDFKYCRCKKVAVDGGLSYARRVYPTEPEVDYVELSEYVNDTPSNKL